MTDVLTELSRAEDLAAAGELDDGRTIAEAVLARDAEQPRARNVLGFVAHAEGRLDDAERELSLASAMPGADEDMRANLEAVLRDAAAAAGAESHDASAALVNRALAELHAERVDGTPPSSIEADFDAEIARAAAPRRRPISPARSTSSTTARSGWACPSACSAACSARRSIRAGSPASASWPPPRPRASARSWSASPLASGTASTTCSRTARCWGHDPDAGARHAGEPEAEAGRPAAHARLVLQSRRARPAPADVPAHARARPDQPGPVRRDDGLRELPGGVRAPARSPGLLAAHPHARGVPARPPRRRARARRGDLLAAAPDSTFSLVFVDGCKSWYGTKYWIEHTCEQIPVGSHFIFQDYGWYTCFWPSTLIGVLPGRC